MISEFRILAATVSNSRADPSHFEPQLVLTGSVRMREIENDDHLKSRDISILPTREW
jgi:hypothetical protein